MPRRPRVATGGIAYHALNRAVGRGTLFESVGDYAAFERTIADVHRRLPMRILTHCLMPNHWHLILWPREDGDLSEFLRLLTVTHTQRWHASHGTAGTGPLYQGRFKSFPVQRDRHLLIVCRYVERNALRAGLVRGSATRWRWCSAWHRQHRVAPPAAAGTRATQAAPNPAPPADWLLPLSAWPVDVPGGWTRLVDEPLTPTETDAVRRSMQRSAPFGGERWVSQTAARLGLQSTLRPRGRPPKMPQRRARTRSAQEK